jgi:PKD repeat protein
VDSNGYPHISYYDASNRDLKYTHWNGSTWNTTAVDTEDNVGEYTSIALDSEDIPHISYRDFTNGNLKYAYWNGSTWEITTVDASEGNGGHDTSIDIDSNGNPHISYRFHTNGILKYANWTGTTWAITTIDGSQVVGEVSSMVLDSNDHPHISYYNRLKYSLRYAHWNGTVWKTSTVDTNNAVGRFNSIDVDSKNHPHISYYDLTNDDLMYARWNGTKWLTNRIDTEGNVGTFTSIVVDSEDNPHISYQDVSNNDVKYAKWDGSEWILETIDSEGAVGHFTAITLDSEDNVFMSYWSSAGSKLKFATTLTDTIPPISNAGPDQTVDQGTVVTFDGSESSDNIGIVTYTWSFIDATPHIMTDVSPEYTFNNPGTYIVTLNVSDAAGYFETDSVTITVRDTYIPTAQTRGDQNADEDSSVTLDGSQSSDNVEISSYTWTFIDETEKTLQGEKVTYEFKNPGTYSITLTVTDDWGNVDTDVLTLTIRDVTSPTVDIDSRNEAYLDEQVTFDASGSSDYMGIIEYVWDFGDGNTGDGKTVTHTYTEADTYVVSLTVTDEAGNSATETTQIEIQSEPSKSGIGIEVIAAIGLLLLGIILFFLFGRKKKYVCPICEKSFDSEEKLREHQREEHSESA